MSEITTTHHDRHRDRGAGLVEYALLIALIAIVCFAAVQLLGGEGSASFSRTASSVAGT